MKLGLFAVNYGTCGDPASSVRVVQAAEAAGFESVWTGEHIVLPLRNPVLLAKELASLDVASGGRLIVGVGAGGVEAYAAAGVHRLVVLPRPDANHAQRHDPVPLDDILLNIENARRVVERVMG